MALSNKLRNWEPQPVIDWRAQRIDDPVRKLAYLRRSMDDRPLPVRRPIWRRLMLGAGLIATCALLIPAPPVVSDVSPAAARHQVFPERRAGAMPQHFAKVWMVEEGPEYELYSNGLRIDTSFAVANNPRFYQVLDRKRDLQPSADWKSQPAGIVFHTTESTLPPFEQDQNSNLKRSALALLGNLRDRKSYNFVIDRFGRVFKVVPEDNAANHAGNSVWADQDNVYLNLNSSFLGISFEAQTMAGDGGQVINQAQMHAGRILTELLRAKYKIPAENCVTHAQVSVNPHNLLIGYHTDWARNFPYEEMGLGNNYDLTLPSIPEFGFEYDSLFRKAMGPATWKGLIHAEERLAQDAKAHRRSLSSYRATLHERYRRLYSTLKGTGAMEESSDATNAN